MKWGSVQQIHNLLLRLKIEKKIDKEKNALRRRTGVNVFPR